MPTEETLLATLTTNSKGEATYTYTGSGNGIINLIAKYGESVQSSVYELIDAIYYDPCTSDTSSNYYILTNVGNEISFTGNSLRYTVGTSNKTIGYDTNYSPITASDYLGKTVRFSVNVNPSNQCRLAIAQLVNGSWRVVNSSYVSSQTTLTIDGEIDENATRFAFRIDCNNGSSGDTVDFNNWTIYPI